MILLISAASVAGRAIPKLVPLEDISEHYKAIMEQSKQTSVDVHQKHGCIV